MVIMSGTIKTGGAFEVKGKKGPQLLISFVLIDELGNNYACQMWPDDPQHAQLAQSIEQLRRRRVQCEVSGYSVRMRKFQDGTEKPQANFIITNVQMINAPAANPQVA